MILLTTPFLIFAYHYLRNGWPLTKWLSVSTTVGRLMWCLCFTAAYGLVSTLPSPITGLILFVLSFIAILIPHGVGMDMGRWGTFQNAWPTFFIKIKQEDWERYPLWKKELVDGSQLFVIGLLRGLIVFLPFNALPAALLVAAWHPAAYWFGWRTPIAALCNGKNSSEWGEFYLALAWAVSLSWVFGG